MTGPQFLTIMLGLSGIVITAVIWLATLSRQRQEDRVTSMTFDGYAEYVRETVAEMSDRSLLANWEAAILGDEGLHNPDWYDRLEEEISRRGIG